MRSRRISTDATLLRASQALAVVLLVAVYVLFVGTAEGRAIDFVLAHRGRSPGLAGVGLITAAVVATLLLPIGVCLATVALLRHGRRIGRYDDGIRSAVTIITAAVVARALEAILEVVDPVRGEAARQLGSAFYPSGHAAAAMALCLAMTVVLRDRGWRLLLLVGGIWCSVQGFVIFATGSHHISDVLGGFLLGFAVAAVIMLRPRAATRPHLRVGQTTLLVMLTGVIAAVIAAELARQMAVSALPPPAVLVMAAAGLSAAGFSLVAMFLRLLEATRGTETGHASPAVRPPADAAPPIARDGARRPGRSRSLAIDPAASPLGAP